MSPVAAAPTPPPGAAPAEVVITGAPVGIGELLEIARGARVELADDARATIVASRAVVDEVLARGRPVYGVNTGVGHQHDVRVPDDELRAMQHQLVAMHATGIGPPLPTVVVRAALATRLVGITRGRSGASPAVADALVALLNAGVHPVVASVGSVGAGDLGQMATMALVAVGSGVAELDGETLAGAEALRRAGITPLVLEPKDGLALISSNAVTIGHAALVAERAMRAADLADAVAAVAMEAVRANPSVVAPTVGRAKPFPGQIESGRHLSELLAGSDLLAEGGARSVQDPLSFRVVPQVHGAFREMVAVAGGAVATELTQLAAPATLDVGPLDLGVEDHHTSAPLGVRKAEAALDLLEDVLSVEALLARDVLTTVHPGVRLGRGPAALLRRVDGALAATADRTPAAIHRAVRAALTGTGGR
jgi:histidine ammonia-lyase